MLMVSSYSSNKQITSTAMTLHPTVIIKIPLFFSHEQAINALACYDYLRMNRLVTEQRIEKLGETELAVPLCLNKSSDDDDDDGDDETVRQ